eukprot:1010845-Prorocentrum_lima.AAC.1
MPPPHFLPPPLRWSLPYPDRTSAAGLPHDRRPGPTKHSAVAQPLLGAPCPAALPTSAGNEQPTP